MAAAVDAVFDTTELLEAILSQLEPKDLLLSQRVSKTWKLAIAASRGLQEQLFLRPIGVEHSPEITLYPTLDEGIRSCYIHPAPCPSPLLRNPFIRDDLIDAVGFPTSSNPEITPSWRNMLIFQHAPYRIIFRFDEFEKYFETAIANTKGVRLGQVLDELREPGLEFNGSRWIVRRPFLFR